MAALFRELGVNTCWVGGGAGSLDLVCRPVVITPGGLRSRVVVVAGLEETATLGVTHGWHPIGEALLVTEAEGNDILTLEWRHRRVTPAKHRVGVDAVLASELVRARLPRQQRHHCLTTFCRRAATRPTAGHPACALRRLVDPRTLRDGPVAPYGPPVPL